MQWELDLAPAPPAVPAALDEQQRVVVEHRHGPLLVQSAPGALTARITTEYINWR